MKKMWVMTSVSTLGPTVNGVQVPKGRLTVHAVSRPFGTYCAWIPDPNVETLGYCHKSLRDNDLPDVWECSRRWHWVASPRATLGNVILELSQEHRFWDLCRISATSGKMVSDKGFRGTVKGYATFFLLLVVKPQQNICGRPD